VGIVASRTSTDLIVGTGSLIGPNVVLTCAHNVFQKKIKKDHTDIEFLPASIAREMKNSYDSGQGFRVKKAIVPSQYREMDCNSNEETNQGLIFDFAVLILETDLNLEEYFGSFSYNFDW
jgi:V8-like Glu-specific endopeptidase